MTPAQHKTSFGGPSLSSLASEAGRHPCRTVYSGAKLMCCRWEAEIIAFEIRPPPESEEHLTLGI